MQLGVVFATFSWSYFMFQIPTGILGDKFGPRKVLAGIVVLWSIVDIITGLSWSFVSLIVLRFLFGMAEAGAFPNATRAFSHWIPATERGFAQGLSHGFSRLGGAVTPLLVVVIVAYFHSWRPVFFMTAGVALTWALFWFVWYRNKPTEYRDRWGGISQTEIDIIEQGRSRKQSAKLAVGKLLKSKNMWLLCLGYFCYNYTLWIFLTWLPTYLVTARGFTIVKMGIFASMPLFAGTVGDTFGGWLSDRIWLRTKNGKLARRSVAMGGFIIAAACMIPGAMTHSQYLSVFFLACALFGLEMSVGVFWATTLDIGHEYAGTVSGTMNCVGNMGSMVTPLVFGFIVQRTGSWMYPFLVASGVLVVGSVLWAWINPELSVAEELHLNDTAVTPEEQLSLATHA
jgi:sugar phosphate permease